MAPRLFVLKCKFPNNVAKVARFIIKREAIKKSYDIYRSSTVY